jgi:hypothetical protein
MRRNMHACMYACLYLHNEELAKLQAPVTAGSSSRGIYSLWPVDTREEIPSHLDVT